MAKISVRHGVARAYGFLVGRVFQVLGLSWLPALFYAVAATFLIEHMSGAMQSAVPADASLLGEYALFDLLALVTVTAFLGAVISVPLAREALGRHDEWAAAHFVVGPRETRMFFALLRFYAVIVIASIALAFATGIAVTTGARYAGAQHLQLDWAGIRFQVWLDLAAAFVAVAVFLIVAARLSFLLAPMAAAEKHVSLARAARMSRGNFWRIAFIYLVVGLPAMLLLLTCETSFGGLEMGKTLPSGMQAFYTVAPSHIWIFATVLAVGLVVLQALFAGASAAAYEELADTAVYDAEPAAAFHEPAMAFADAGPRGFTYARPTDHRFTEQREDLASAAAAEAAMPSLMEMQPEVRSTPPGDADLRMQAPMVHEENPPQPEEHAQEPAAADEPAALAPTQELQAAEDHADVTAHPNAPAEHAEEAPVIIDQVQEAPPLDPVGAMAAAAPHEEYTPPG